MKIKKIIVLILTLALLVSCSTGVVQWKPESLTDTSDVVITCDASKGNRGLYSYKGNVYVHIGAVTNQSETPDTWHYIKFVWGSQEPQAITKPAGENKWSYSIHNIRKFFKVADDEKIWKIAILFRGACSDSCNVLRNEDGSDIFIPVHDKDGP